MSNAAAITLGIMPGRMHRVGCTRCLNLLLTYPEGCRANCAYCGLARHREAERDYADRNFIRVDWPAVPMQQVVDTVARDGGRSPFHRMCISMITHPRSDEDTVAVLKAWTAKIDPSTIPVSILSNPTTMERKDVERLRELGADIFTVALDAVHAGALRSHARQGRAVAAQVAEVLGSAACMRARCSGRRSSARTSSSAWARPSGRCSRWCSSSSTSAGTATCSRFFPEQGSLMDHLPATPRDQWRRVQLARYLIDYAGVRVEQMSFDAEGRVTGYALPPAEVEDIVSQGIAFRTSGCPGKVRDDVSACDRPYGDSPPSNIASFPFQPNKRDLRKIRRQLKIPVVQG